MDFGKIGLLAILFQVTIGVALGMIAALNRGRPVDHVIRVLVVLAICVPSFVFAAVLQYFLAFKWKLVPVFGWGELKHYILPVAAYAIGGIASYTKYTRSSMISVIGEDYIVTAQAKGCNRKRSRQKTRSSELHDPDYYHDRTGDFRSVCRILYS